MAGRERHPGKIVMLWLGVPVFLFALTHTYLMLGEHWPEVSALVFVTLSVITIAVWAWFGSRAT